MTPARLARFAFGFGVSGLLLFALLRAIDLAALGQALQLADYRLLPLAIALYFLGLWFRSKRWALLLPPRSASTSTLFRTLAVGFTINNVLPARLGEVARAVLLARWCGVSYGTTLASVIVERILDGLTLAALLLVSLAFVAAPGYLFSLGLLVALVFAGGALTVALAAWKPGVVVAMSQRVGQLMPARIRAIVERAAVGFNAGLHLVRDGKVLARLFALSLLAWFAEIGLFYSLMFAFPIPSSFALAVLTGTVANFATLVPSSPGYVGTFDSALVAVLRDTTAITTELAAAYALVVHAALFFPVTMLGLVVLWRSRLSLAQVTPSRQKLSAANRRGAVAVPPALSTR